jgi:hypothetical protein
LRPQIANIIHEIGRKEEFLKVDGEPLAGGQWRFDRETGWPVRGGRGHRNCCAIEEWLARRSLYAPERSRKSDEPSASRDAVGLGAAFIHPREAGVAYLALTLRLGGDRVVIRPRRQPLIVPPDAVVIPVARIETDWHSAPAMSPGQRAEAARAAKTVGLLIL